VGGNLLDSGSRSGAEGGGVGTGTLFGFGMRSGGICGIGVGEGAANGDGDGEAEGDVLGCAFCARKVTLMQQKTTTKKVRIIIIAGILTRVHSKKRANGRDVKGYS
jgi:hypothetical protein